MIGGGYIAVEFAGIFQGFGSETTIAYRADLPLRGFDLEVRETVATNLASRGTTVMPNTNPKEIKKNDDGSLTVSHPHSPTEETDTLFYPSKDHLARARRPRVVPENSRRGFRNHVRRRYAPFQLPKSRLPPCERPKHGSLFGSITLTVYSYQSLIHAALQD